MAAPVQTPEELSEELEGLGLLDPPVKTPVKTPEELNISRMLGLDGSWRKLLRISAITPSMLPMPDVLHERILKFIPKEVDAEKIAMLNKFGTGHLSCKVNCPVGHHCHRSGDDGCIVGEATPGRERCCQQRISDSQYLGLVADIATSAFFNQFNAGDASKVYKERLKDILRPFAEGIPNTPSPVFSEPDNPNGYHVLELYPKTVVFPSFPDRSKLDVIKLGSKLFKQFYVIILGDDFPLLNEIDR